MHTAFRSFPLFIPVIFLFLFFLNQATLYNNHSPSQIFFLCVHIRFFCTHKIILLYTYPKSPD